MWPIVLAFGLTLAFGGLLLGPEVSILGGIVTLAAAVGWFRDVLPLEAHEEVTVEGAAPAVVTARTKVGRLAEVPESVRAALPLETYPVSAGIKGGLAGGAAMAVLAAAYGIFSGNTIWYPMNLLTAGFFPGAASKTAAEIGIFRWHDLFIAIPIHLLICLLVGVLYGALLPMLPRRPVLLGGLIAPLMWSGLIYGILGFVNPVLNARIDWFWFVLSQVGFGVVAGIVVSMQERLRTGVRLPFMFRAGVEGSGFYHDRDEGGPR